MSDRLVVSAKPVRRRGLQPRSRRSGKMTRFILGRLGQLVIVLIGVSIIVFFTMHVFAGRRRNLAAGRARPRWANWKACVIDSVSINRSGAVFRFRFVANGSWRFRHFASQQPPGIFRRLDRLSYYIAACLGSSPACDRVGVPIGSRAAMRSGGVWDNFLMTATLFGVSMPIFWLGLMLLWCSALGSTGCRSAASCPLGWTCHAYRHDGGRQPNQR